MQDYFEAMDYPAIRARYPAGERFMAEFRGLSRDALRARQEADFRRVLAFAWKVPFYQRLWSAAGAEPGDIRGLDDLPRLPVYDKSDLMRSVEAHPPIGDFHGQDAHPPERRPPLILQTTSGTTGRPQPLLYGPRSREVQALLLARLYRLQGMTADDCVHSVYGFGMVNGGHYVRETVLHWVGARMLTAGTGVDTRSAQQVRLMADFGATAIVGFADYIRRLAEVAREEGLVPGEDIRVRLISGHLGAESADALSAAWGGAEVYDWYGVGDTGAIAGQGPDRQGMHVLEDAQYLELLDVDGQGPVAPGGAGDMVVTCLYKDDIFPIIRFNSHDVTREVAGDNPLGLPFRRIEGFLGRSDNMVKLRGINIFPTGVGALLSGLFPEMTGEYVCRVEAREGREEMTAVVEVGERAEGLAARMEAVLRERLGVQIAVELVGPRETAALTGIETRQKPVRLIDRRKG